VLCPLDDDAEDVDVDVNVNVDVEVDMDMDSARQYDEVKARLVGWHIIIYIIYVCAISNNNINNNNNNNNEQEKEQRYQRFSIAHFGRIFSLSQDVLSFLTLECMRIFVALHNTAHKISNSFSFYFY